MSSRSEWIQDDPAAPESFESLFLKAEAHYRELLFR